MGVCVRRGKQCFVLVCFFTYVKVEVRKCVLLSVAEYEDLTLRGHSFVAFSRRRTTVTSRVAGLHPGPRLTDGAENGTAPLKPREAEGLFLKTKYQAIIWRPNYIFT